MSDSRPRSAQGRKDSTDSMKLQTLLILTYHAIVDTPLDVPDWSFMARRDFDAQMEFVARFGNTVPLKTALAAPARLPSPAIAVTFDDGFRSNFDLALPTLKRYAIPATVFLATAFVDSRQCLWFCRVNRAIAATELTMCHWKGQTFDLSSIEARANASIRIQAQLKKRSHSGLLRELDGLCSLLGEEHDSPLDDGSPYATLSTEAIGAMRATGLIDFG